MLFKCDYELEPLYEDIFQGVQAPLSAQDNEYSHNQFRTDIGQITTWELVDYRIEKQRLRSPKASSSQPAYP